MKFCGKILKCADFTHWTHYDFGEIKREKFCMRISFHFEHSTRQYTLFAYPYFSYEKYFYDVYRLTIPKYAKISNSIKGMKILSRHAIRGRVLWGRSKWFQWPSHTGHFSQTGGPQSWGDSWRSQMSTLLRTAGLREMDGI